MSENILDKSIDLVQKYAPKFFAENPIAVIDTLMKNMEFAQSVVNMVKFAVENGAEAEIKATLVHDIVGLHNGETFFTPRAASY